MDIQPGEVKEDKEDVKDYDCAICGLPLSCKYTYKLKCSHEFHYECLLKTLQSSIVYNHNVKKNQCPYCRDRCGYIPAVNGLKKLTPGIHDILMNSDFQSVKCQHILTRGKRKGLLCDKNCKIGYMYCVNHCPKINS